MIVKSALPLAFIIGSRFFGLFIILPVISVYALELRDANEFLIGVLIGTYAIAQIIFQVPFGYLSDRIGRKNSMFVGLVIFIIGAIVCSQAHDIYTMIFGRFIQGSGAIGAVATALMSDMTKEEVRGHAMAMMGAFIGLSFTLSMIIAPILSSKFGISSLFYLSILITVVCIILLYTLIGQEPKIIHNQVKIPISQLLTNKNLVIMNLSNFMQKMLMSAAFIVIPIAVVHGFNMQKSDLSQIYAIATFFGFVAMGIGGGVGEMKQVTKQILVIGVALFVVAYAIFTLSLEHKFIFYVGIVIFFVGFNLHEPILQSMASKFSKASQKGTVLGLFNAFGYFGNFIGGIGGGFLLTHFDISVFSSLVAALCAIWLFSLKWLDNPKIFKNLYIPIAEKKVDFSSLDNVFGVIEYYIRKDELVIKYNSKIINEAQLKEHL